MIRATLAWMMMTAAAFAASGEYGAIVKSNAAVRAAPAATAVQIGVAASGTAVDVDICFYEGTYCHVTAAGIDGYVAGELLTISGDINTVMTAERARWDLIRTNQALETVPEWEPTNVVVWGDSLSTKALGDLLSTKLPGRSISMQGVPGDNGQQIADRMLGDTRYDHRLKLIWDRHYPTETPENYMRDITPMIEKAKATGDFLIVSDIRPLLTQETIPDIAVDGSVTTAVNAQLAELYPNNFVDVAAVLEDITTRAPDGLHLSALGNARVADVLASAIEARPKPQPRP